MTSAETGTDDEGSRTPQMTESMVIERIYKIALEPHSYDDFMAHWDDYVTQALANLSELQRDTNEEAKLESERIASHFETGFRLIEELGRTSPANFFDSQLKGSDLPKILLDKAGIIVWYNNAAQRALPVRKQAVFSDLALDNKSRQSLSELLKELRAGQLTRDTTVIRVDSEHDGQPVYLVASATTDRNEERLLVLQQAASEWLPAVSDMLIDAFALSSAEVDIARALSEGETVNDIAEQRGSSLNTVRTQVKTVLSKTGAKSQTALIRLIYSLIRVAEQDTRKPRKTIPAAGLAVTAPSGRKIPVHLFGPPNGEPVVFIHGMLDGALFPERMLELAEQNNIRLIAPERPYFGTAEGDPGDIKTAPDRFAEEVEAVLNHLHIDSAIITAQKAGSVYAFAAAAHLGSRAKGVICMNAGVPLVSASQFAFMSRRQRLVAYTARYTPKLLPFVLRAGIRQLDFGGEENFMHALFENSEPDLKELENRETFDIITEGYHYAIAQGHRAFEIDSYQVVRDWTWRAKASDVPVILVHGKYDSVVDHESVTAFAKELGPRAKAIVDQKLGQLVFFARPEYLIEAINELRGKND